MANAASTETQVAWFEGKWQGQGLVVHKNMAYKEMSEFKVLRTSPATIVNV